MSNRARQRSARSPCGSSVFRRAALVLVLLTGAPACAPSQDACCASDADCAAGARCFEGSCRAACSHDVHCLEGEQCLAGACVSPLRSPTHCAFKEKRVPHRPSADGGSLPDAGDPPADAGDPSCEDAFEPNDSRAEAALLGPGLYEAHICPARDDDWYRVVVPSGAIDLSIIARFDHTRGDLDLELLDEGGYRVAVSQLTGDSEEIRLPVQATGAARTYFVHVYGFGRATNPYTLEIALLPSTSVCVDDAFEDNDTEATSTLLATGTMLDAAFCAGDPDVFRAALPARAPAYGVLSYTRGDELALEVRSPAGIEGRSNTFSGLELMPLSLATEGTVYLRVSGTHSHVSARPYRVGLWVVDESCGEDAFEPNHLPAQAKSFVLQPGQSMSGVNGRLCERDVDVWRLSWPATASSLEVGLSAPPGTRGYVVRAEDLSLVVDLVPGETATFRPSINVASGRVLVVLLGAGDDAPYFLRGRSVTSE